ncbi:hypothetical protein [Pseudonocardia acidicola]|uniref:Uncharacterized protein n=1 Tax=Pseudonocardia acidicola TaxID=2724939 RepID=A0ABX1S7U3_9PSEU|nr:hypothetical protein [Pseudonocardia acidicola]NMH97630.1 hypothetical protein [Pseudonocardia acidicola]
MVRFNVFRPDVPGTGPARLLPGMPSGPQHYPAPDQRDFFAAGLAPVATPVRAR